MAEFREWLRGLGSGFEIGGGIGIYVNALALSGPYSSLVSTAGLIIFGKGLYDLGKSIYDEDMAEKLIAKAYVAEERAGDTPPPV